MTVVFTLSGFLLLAGCGAGAGYRFSLWARDRWHSVHTFVRLLEYLQSSVRYRTMTGEQLLLRAASYPEFSRLGLDECTRFGDIPLPRALELSLRRELSVDLHALETAGRETACDIFSRMIALCRAREEELHSAAGQAAQLYPRLGGCLGALLAIALL